RFPAVGLEVLGAATVTLAWATAETSLPPFAATRGALSRLADLPLDAAEHAPRWDRPAYEAEVLAGGTEAGQAAPRRLAPGAAPVALRRAIGHAAAVRLGRFDRAWERRLDAEVGVLDVTHAVTFVESVIALSPKADPRHMAQLAVIAAGFVGKLRHADASGP